MIDGVQIKNLRVIPDERGHLMEILRSDDNLFEKFGQVYVTTTYPGIVKAWHYHKFQDDNVCVVKGMLKLALFDGREDSSSKGEVNEFFIGENNPILVHIPKHVYHGWKCISGEKAYVVNCPTQPYNRENPDEHRLPWNSDKVPYDWEIKMG